METNSTFYRYRISKCDILIPNQDTISLTKANLRGLRIEKDYDNYYFPILSVDFFLTGDVYYKIVENKTAVRFNIKIEKFIKSQTQKTEQIYEFKETVVDALFGIFINDDGYFIDSKLYEESKQMGNDLTGNLYTFFLFKDEDISSSKKMINAVISEGTMTDTLTYLLSKSGAKNVLMTPLENSKLYQQILLLPTTVIKKINNLEKQYGFYKNGSIFYYDFNTTYLINKTANSSAYRKNEYRDVIITCFKRLNSNAATPGSYKDDERHSYILHMSQDNIKLFTQSVIDDQVSGSNVKLISPTSGNIFNIKPDIQTRNKSRTQIVVNNLENDFLSSAIENKKYENANVMTINAYDFDIDCLAPNKRYIVSFEDKEIHARYSGEYRLVSYDAILTEQGEDFDIRASITFKKTI